MDFIVHSAPLFEEWLILERERYRRAAIQLFDVLIEEYIRTKNFESGILTANRLIAIDSWREKVTAAPMHLLALNGDRDDALAQFRLLRRNPVPRNLVLKPSPDTSRSTDLFSLAGFLRRFLRLQLAHILSQTNLPSTTCLYRPLVLSGARRNFARSKLFWLMKNAVLLP